MKKYGKYIFELLIVFLGVYGAFYFERLQEEDKQFTRLKMLIEFLEKDVNEVHEGMTFQYDNFMKEYHDPFLNRKSDQTYKLKPYFNHFPVNKKTFIISSIIEDGGLDAFDVSLLQSLSEYVESFETLYQAAEKFDELSTDKLEPNLNKSPDEFFRANGNLKHEYWWYQRHLYQIKFRLSICQKSSKMLSEELNKAKTLLEEI